MTAPLRRVDPEDRVVAQERMAWAIANRLTPEQPLSREDLVQAGMLMLHRKAHLFRPELGVKFSTWAFSVLRNAMLMENRSTSWRGKSALIEGRQVVGDQEHEEHEAIDSSSIWGHSLDARERFVLLAREAGYGTTEIALMLNLGEGKRGRRAVLAICSLALQKLQG